MPITAPPIAPNVLSPSSGSTISSLTPTLEWLETTSGCTFNVYVYDGGTLVDSVSGISTTSWTLTTSLQYSKTYTWHVEAVNLYGSTTGDTWNFSITAPPVPDAPTDITIDQTDALRPDFSWPASNNAEYYHLKIIKN